MTNKGWKIYKIDNICEVLSSKRIFAADYVKFGIPFYRSKEIIEKAFGENISNLLYIAEEKYNDIKSKYGVPKENDILISAVGERSGIPYLVRNEEFYFKDGNLIWIRNFDDRKIFSKYLCYWFKSKIGQFTLENLMIGSAQKALTIVGIKGIELNLPPLEVQNKIAKVLSALDNKIELNNAINNNLEQQAQAIFKSWFVDKENKNRKTCKAEEYFDISIGKTPPRKEPQWFTHQNSDTKWVSIADMGNCGVYICDTSEYLLPEAISKFNVCLVPKDTVILSFKLTVGRIAITNEMMTTNEAIAHFKTNNKTINEYLYLYLKNFNFKTMGSTSSIATAVNSKIIKAMPFIIPTNEELSIFHKITNPIFKQIKANQLESKNLTQLRDALLPKLMSGEIDVENIDISTDKLSFSIMIIEYFYIKIVIIIGVVNYKNNTFKWSNNPV